MVLFIENVPFRFASLNSLSFLFLKKFLETGVFVAQALLSVLTTFGFLYYGGQVFLENVSFRQYSESFRSVKSNLEDFLSTVDVQFNIVRDMVRLELFNTSSREDWIRVLGSLQEINQAGVVTMYIDLKTNEVTAVDRLDKKFYLTFSETGTQFFEASFDPVSYALQHVYPKSFPSHYNVTTNAWYQRTIAEYNGTVILNAPIASIDNRIVFPAGALLGEARDALLVFRYDVEILDRILGGYIQSFSQSTALIVDSKYRIIGLSRKPRNSPTNNNTSILRTTLFNSTDATVNIVGSYFLDKPLEIGNYSDVNGYFVSVTEIENDYSQDWFFMTITQKPQFISVLYSTGSIFALVAAMVVLFSSLTVLLIAVNEIIHQIRITADSLLNIAQLNISPKVKKYFSLIYEIRLLQEGLNSINLSLGSFAKYIPRTVVQGLLSENMSIQLQVVPRNMTIFFSDIEDFTTISESLSATQLSHYLTQYFTVLASLIEKHSGVVDKFIGDAVVGCWNHLYDSVEHHERLACTTALQAIRLTQQLSTKFVQEQGLPPITIRIGINSGNVLVGNIGTETRYSYTTLGDVSSIASQLEALNKQLDTRVLLGQDTYEKVKEEFLCQWVDVLPCRGTLQPIYELVNWKHKASLEEIETSRKSLEMREYWFQNEMDQVITKALEMKEQYSEQTTKMNYLLQKVLSWKQSTSIIAENPGQENIL